MAAPVAAARVLNGVQDTPLDSDDAPYYRAKTGVSNVVGFTANLTAQVPFVQRATTGSTGVTGLTPQGLFVGNFTQRASRGEVDVVGYAASLSSINWRTLPMMSINRSLPFPQYLTGIRATYLNDPQGLATQVGMLPVFPTYDASQRVGDLKNALPTVSEMATLVPGFTGYLPGDLYGQYDDTSPYVTAAFSDFGNRTVTFSAPAMLGSIPYAINAVGPISVVPTALPGFAVGQRLTMMVSAATALTTSPATQGWNVDLIDETSPMKIYLFSRTAVAGMSAVSVAHTGGGRLGVIICNWDNYDPTTPLDAAPTLALSTTALTTPAISPTLDRSAVVSLLADTGQPAYTAPPTGMTLIQQMFVSTTFFMGAAYVKQTAKANTGVLTWNMTNAGGQKAGVTFALRGSWAPVTIPMCFIRNGITYPYDLVVTP